MFNSSDWKSYMDLCEKVVDRIEKLDRRVVEREKMLVEFREMREKKKRKDELMAAKRAKAQANSS